ncbi:MAG: hypothetical protein NTW64_04450 [Candidatus Omnitrophica bacterium]|nr:hypothetical protein [Candidatus Omnitrophota bacterium]
MIFNKDDFHKIIDLFLVSFLALYFEILFIRWIPSSVQIVAYFTNIILISSFLGLGLGCLLTEIKFELMKALPSLLLIMVTLLMGISHMPVKATFIKGEHLLGFYESQGVNFLVIIVIIFIFNALFFVPLGQKLGICLKYFRPLIAYSINITGSIMGIAVFSFLSYLMFEPFHWFLFGLLLMCWFFIPSKKRLLFNGLVFVSTLFVILQMNAGSYWSPYYKIDVYPYISQSSKKVLGLFISANNTHHQYAFNLTEESVKALPELKHYKEIYEFPYDFISPRNVLILGAGSGNDAAAALRRGAKEVYAVEIDPFIASLGGKIHPERPYASKNVHLFIDDARSFIKKTDARFDLISFGYLDAHTVLSQFSSVRLDNFIYTKESFKDIKNHLSEDGMVSLTYLVFREWIGSKLYTALKDVFGDDLRVFRASTYQEGDTAIFLAGPGARNISAANNPDFKLYYGFDKNSRFITDDWPYLYLFKREIPRHYLVILVLIFIISFLGVVCIGPGTLKKFNAHFFLLGAGFMLLETVGITRFALLFGSTWLVNSAVIISILIMVLLANLYVWRARSIDIKAVYFLLIATIFLDWLLKPEFYLVFNRPIGIMLSSLALSLPMLFASVIFASSFKEAKDIPGVFAYNMLGAIAGGFCEYISMATGFNFLLLLAIAIYYISYRSKIIGNYKRLA